MACRLGRVARSPEVVDEPALIHRNLTGCQAGLLGLCHDVTS